MAKIILVVAAADFSSRDPVDIHLDFWRLRCIYLSYWYNASTDQLNINFQINQNTGSPNLKLP